MRSEVLSVPVGYFAQSGALVEGNYHWQSIKSIKKCCTHRETKLCACMSRASMRPITVTVTHGHGIFIYICVLCVGGLFSVIGRNKGIRMGVDTM
jgi:hypothetical protein